MKWYLLAWQRFAEFNGRSRRMEFWMFALVNWIVLFVLSFGVMGFGVAKQPVVGASSGMIAAAYGLAALVPCVSCTVRRLHDTGKTGWWTLLWLVPVLGEIPLLVMLAMDGTRGSNRYGADPKAPELSAAMG